MDLHELGYLRNPGVKGLPVYLKFLNVFKLLQTFKLLLSFAYIFTTLYDLKIMNKHLIS